MPIQNTNLSNSMQQAKNVCFNLNPIQDCKYGKQNSFVNIYIDIIGTQSKISFGIKQRKKSFHDYKTMFSFKTI